MMPPARERHVDLIRSAAIWAVVLGHWFVIAVTRTEGGIDGVNALRELGWAHPLTWGFQVMPLFFVAAGYANAASLSRWHGEGGDRLGWVIHRYRRLLGPSSALLAVIVTGVALARLAGVAAGDAARAAWLATIPLWFLTVYLGVLLLAPLAQAAQRRAGLAVPAVLGLAVAAADLTRFSGDAAWAANLNYLLVWLLLHQLGFAWRDGLLPARARPGALLAGLGLTAVVALSVLGPYPVSMVRVPGATLHNSEPPSLALLALGLAQVGLVLALREPASRWLRGDRPWGAVSLVQSRVLTLFLWHMAAAVVAALALYGSGLVPPAEVGSARWLLWRIPWIAGCLAVLVGLTAVFGRIEQAWLHGARGLVAGRGAAALVALGAVAGSITGMLGIALAGSGVHGPLALPSWALASFGLGFALLLAASALGERNRAGDAATGSPRQP